MIMTLIINQQDGVKVVMGSEDLSIHVRLI